MEKCNENLIKLVETTNEKLDKLFEAVNTIKNSASLKDEWMDSYEVCDSLHICKRTLQNHFKNGKFRMTKMGGRAYFKKSEITEFMEKNNKYYNDNSQDEN